MKIESIEARMINVCFNKKWMDCVNEVSMIFTFHLAFLRLPCSPIRCRVTRSKFPHISSLPFVFTVAMPSVHGQQSPRYQTTLLTHRTFNKPVSCTLLFPSPPLPNEMQTTSNKFTDGYERNGGQNSWNGAQMTSVCSSVRIETASPRLPTRFVPSLSADKSIG